MKNHFVVHKHAATHLHYDFRLEVGKVYKSWAIPKGPSLNPSVKRLAVMVEDHPLSYGPFEGVLPQGSYGAGTVMLWDRGAYTTEESAKEAIRRGHFTFTLHGKKLKGAFSLIRMKDSSWLLIKVKDDFASTKDVTKLVRSVKTDRTMREIAKEEA